MKNFYTGFSESGDESSGELESIVEVLKDRNFKDRAEMYRLISGCLKDYISDGDEVKTRIFKEMLQHYHDHVLD